MQEDVKKLLRMQEGVDQLLWMWEGENGVDGLDEGRMVSPVWGKSTNYRKFHMDRYSGYGWHNPYLAPEVRRACLNGGEIVFDQPAAIYTLMAEWYGRLSGSSPPCDFQVYRSWKRELRERAEEYQLSSEELDCLVRAIEVGTRHRREKRNIGALQQIFTEMPKSDILSRGIKLDESSIE